MAETTKNHPGLDEIAGRANGLVSRPVHSIDPPGRSDSQTARATALAQEGHRREAIALFREVLDFRPNHNPARFNLGVALAQEKRFTEALECFQEVVRCQPNCGEAHVALANVLGELGRDDEAVAAYHEALRHKPDLVDALNNLGVALTRLHRGSEAVIFLRQAVRLRPDFTEGHNNLGLAYAEEGDFTAAIACFEEALRLDPRSVNAHSNLGSALHGQGKSAEAVASYGLALALKPDCATTHWNRSLAWLLMGDFQKGWPEYEWRWQRKEAVQQPFPQPRWDGSALPDGTILLHAEQGLGDILQFVRYAPLVKERVRKVIVAGPLPVAGLFRTCPGVDGIVTENEALPAFDVQAPLMSLPGLLGTTLATIPANVPYLAAEPAKLEQWRERLRGVSGFRVGIAWQGNPRHKGDRHRSFPLALLAPLAHVGGVSLVSLQKGAGNEQLAQSRFPVVDVGPELADFTDTAAVMMCLDLVISCDTAPVHLAGALGVPVWVALSTILDWRWLLDREDSPWYPTMRLFRQRRLGEWKPVFRHMARQLRRLVRSRLKPGAGGNPLTRDCAALAASN
jgi:tetratricopeptide (TPR) repeat protein